MFIYSAISEAFGCIQKVRVPKVKNEPPDAEIPLNYVPAITWLQLTLHSVNSLEEPGKRTLLRYLKHHNKREHKHKQ